MSKEDIARLEALYKETQRRFTLEAGNGVLNEATRFSANQRFPIHRWFHFKEGFSANILAVAGVQMDALDNANAVFLDPFCGSGTSLLAGDLQYQWRGQRIGIEINPFLEFVANTKVNWRRYNPDRMEDLIRRILAQPLQTQLPFEQWPELSSFHNPEMFDPRKVSALVDAVERVSRLTDIERNLLMLGIAAAAERIGYYRKDGRALRKIRSESTISERERLVVDDVLREIWSSYVTDLKLLQSRNSNCYVGDCMVIRGDGRKISLSDRVSPGQVDLIAYSPPYLNHIDYTEVYKVELWLLKFVKTKAEMLDLRKQTMRSHASVAFSANGTNLPQDVVDAVTLAASIVEKTGKKWHLRFRDTAFGYFEDIHATLSRQIELLRPGAQAVCVVANSSHGSRSHRIPVVSDLLIARIAERIGFEVEKLLIARKMPRRDGMNGFSRESIIFLRRPK